MTSHLHGIAWSSGKLDSDMFFAVFYNMKVKNAEMSAKGLETYRLLTRLLARNVENLDDYGCPKIQKFKILPKRICSSYLSDTKQGFNVPRGKQRCSENELCNICIFLYVSIVCVYY